MDLTSTEMIAKQLAQCTDDMRQAAQNGKISLDAQVRAYDLLECILDYSEVGKLGPAEEFCAEYARLSERLSVAYDESELLEEALSRIKPLEEELGKLASIAADAEALHRCAKETFDIWQTSGYFARHRALRLLRSLAGFRLESNRIGNYVAKTYDLMNEAQSAYARAQQNLFSANVAYKIKPGLYSQISAVLLSAV